MLESFFAIVALLAVWNGPDGDKLPCDDYHSLWEVSEFPVGIAINCTELTANARYREKTIKEFNSILPDQIFRFASLHPAPDTFHWALADSLADFCQTTRKRLHGHALLSHTLLPAWLRQFRGDSAQLEQRFKTHIQTVVSHFKGRIEAWDVVHEAYNDDGTMRPTFWHKKLGDGYLERAFRYAREADPDALLFYSDYGLESNPVKRKAVLDKLEDLKRKGVRVDGVGMHLHMSVAGPGTAVVSEGMGAFAAAGYRLHLAEIDICLDPENKELPASPELLQQQTRQLAAVIRAYKELPHELRYGITFWGITRQNCRIRHFNHRYDTPFLFDEGYHPGAVYCSVKEAL